MIGLNLRRKDVAQEDTPAARLVLPESGTLRNGAMSPHPREVSCRVSNAILKYLVSRGYDAETAVGKLPYEPTYLTNPANWITCDARDALCERAAVMTGNPAVMYEVGLSIPSLNPLGGVERLVLLLGNPYAAYKSVPRYAAYLDRLLSFAVHMDGPTRARVSMTLLKEYAWSKHACYFAQGVLAAVPTLWGLPQARVREIGCMCDSLCHGTQPAGSSAHPCEYEVDWSFTPSAMADAPGSRMDTDESVAATIRQLETDFELLDAKNADLLQRELQLSKVREIALALDAAESVSDVFRRTVTLAHDIPGVGFVIAQWLDTSGMYVTIPSGSPLGDKGLVKALAMSGFDFNHNVGEISSEPRFRFPLSKSKAARDSIANPRVLTGSRLGELMEGLWPTALCDRVQSALKVEQYVIVPVTAGGESAGGLIFFLQQDVPQDILEMVSAHCAAAIKNAEALEVLEKRNRELWIVNEIARHTSSSLQPQEVLKSAVQEIRRLLKAEAVAIHVGQKNSPTVQLVAQDGMPDELAKAAASVPREACDRELYTADGQEFLSKYSQFKPLVAADDEMFFSFARLPFKGNWLGRLTVTRRGRPLDESGESVLRSVASHLALAVENAYLHAEVLSQAQAERAALDEVTASEARLANSERKYRLIAQNTTDYVAVLTLKGIYNYISPSCKTLGYCPDEILGRSAFDFIHPEDRRQLVTLLAGYAAKPIGLLAGLHKTGYSKLVQFRFRDAKGTWLFLEAVVNLVEAGDGQGFNLICVSRDVTERTKAEEALRRTHGELEERVQERTAQLRKTNTELQSQIVERQRAEAALRASEERFKMLFEFAPDAYYLSDTKGNFVDGNSAAERLLGYRKEDLIGRSFLKLEILSKDQKATAAKLLAKNRAGLSSGPDAFVIRRGDGEKLTVEVTTLPVKLGAQSLVLGIARDATEHKRIEDTLLIAREELEQRVIERTADLTRANEELQAEVAERRRAEQNLRQSEERYRTVFESANDLFLLIDRHGRILDVNQRLMEIGGYERQDLIGKRIGTLSHMMPKRSLALVMRNFAARMVGKEIPPYEVEMRRMNGETAIMEVSAVAVHKDGKIVSDLAILRDVSARKRAEASLKTQSELIDRILATIPNAVAVLDRNRRIVLANQALRASFGVEGSNLCGTTIDEFLPADELEEAIEAVTQGTQSHSRLEFRRTVEEKERILLANLFSMHEDEVLLVLTDITDERDSQERLYLTDRLASVGEMASGIAHELNNPLTSMIGLSELLTEEELPDELREDVEAINQEAQRAAVIVRNLLTFARKHAPTKQPVQMNDVIRDVLRLRAYEHKIHNIKVDLALDEDLPKVSVDYYQMQQVLLNVILNAENAITGARESGAISIVAEQRDARVQISIADDGPGISKQNVARIFDPFFTTKEVGKGTGLGLSICYGILSQHGGGIRVESEPGQGATFIIELPI